MNNKIVSHIWNKKNNYNLHIKLNKINKNFNLSNNKNNELVSK